MICREGTRLGYKEGQDLGILKGFEIVSELGYFRGSILVSLQRLQDARVLRHPQESTSAYMHFLSPWKGLF